MGVGKAFRATCDKLAAFLRWCWNGHPGARKPWLRRTLTVIFFFLIPAPVALLLLFRFVPVPFTPEMIFHIARFEPVRQQWVAFDAIAPALGRAVIGAEDENFCRHHGFDWKSIDDAWRTHMRHPKRPLRGASTISQQVARTIFLLPVRSWIRKGAEAYLTVLIEALWPKRRILAAYLNLVDWGHGNFGAEAAAQTYFHTSAAKLSLAQAARLASVLPNPDVWRATRPGPYVSGRSARLVARSSEVVRDGLDWCVRN